MAASERLLNGPDGKLLVAGARTFSAVSDIRSLNRLTVRQLCTAALGFRPQPLH